MPPIDTRRRDAGQLAEILALVALTLLLVVIAGARRTFIGDGIRHLPNVITAVWPPLGEPRWLLFPTVVWAIVRPFVSIGWVTTIDSAIRPFLATSVLAGIVYLLGLRLWLRADGHNSATRTSALLLAAGTMPFLRLYSDIAEVQLAGAAVVAALAVVRDRRGAESCSNSLAIAVVAVIGAASLVYQGLIVALGLVPLVVPSSTLRNRRVLLAAAAIVMAVPTILVGARWWAGDPFPLALTTVFGGETNPLTRTFMGRATPVKWAAALLAGPPQAIVGLDSFAGLRALTAALSDPRTMGAAIANTIRLAIGAALLAAFVAAVVRRRDWRLAVALAAVVVLPVVRNDQYTYVKFFVLWPALMALASTAFDPHKMAAAAALVLGLNGSLIVFDVVQGRRLSAEMNDLYANAHNSTCFFTSDWGAPFSYRWPGTTAAVIETLATGVDPAVQARALTGSLERCFCNASAVWTDTTADAAPVVAILTDHFQYSALDLRPILLRPSEDALVGTGPTRVYAYPADRQADICRRIRAADGQR